MRIGSRRTKLMKQADGVPTLASLMYGDMPGVWERHRHKYEVNPEKVDALEAAGLRFTGDTACRTRAAPRSLSACQLQPYPFPHAA